MTVLHATFDNAILCCYHGGSYELPKTRTLQYAKSFYRTVWIILVRHFSLFLHILSGALKTRDWKTRNWKTRHQIAGVENAGPENGGTSKLWKAVAVENVQHS